MNIIFQNIEREEVIHTTKSDVDKEIKYRLRVNYQIVFDTDHYIRGVLYWYRKDCIIEDIINYINIVLSQ
jgi:hypothetical protein